MIARVLGAMVGKDNVAGPTLSSLQGDFGPAPLIGKSLAVISDARLNGRLGSAVVERLLSVSGEDTLTVNIKYEQQWRGTLPSRFMVCCARWVEPLGDLRVGERAGGVAASRQDDGRARSAQGRRGARADISNA